MAEDEKQDSKSKDAGGGSSGNGNEVKSGPRAYTILGAVGPKDAKPEDLDWRVIAEIEAATQAKAKEALLGDNPDFPGLDPKPSGSGAGGSDPAAQPVDLQSLVRSERLWLHAESGWNPKPVIVNQPPPKFEGL